MVCGGGSGLLVLWLWRGSDESNRLAAEVVVLAPGANLPAGASPRAIRVTEFQGVFQVKAQINNTDVVFKKQGAMGALNNNNRRCKEYVIDLEAGKSYTIDLESRDFDAYLWLEQLNGVMLQQDDDGGGGQNSRIQFVPPQTASYVVIATSLNGGTGCLHPHRARNQVRQASLNGQRSSIHVLATDRWKCTCRHASARRCQTRVSSTERVVGLPSPDTRWFSRT